MPSWRATSVMLPLQRSTARAIIERSISSSVVKPGSADAGAGAGRSSSVDGVMAPPSQRMTAFSMVCCSSRMLPAQGYSSIWRRASESNPSIGLPYFAA